MCMLIIRALDKKYRGNMNLLDKYKAELLNSIPVVAAMDVQIKDISDNSITLGAPLNTNINYEGTVFGGSLNTACILSCYLLVHHLLKSKKIEFSSLVIQNSTINYKLPVQDDFLARAKVTSFAEQNLVKLLDKKGVGRIEVNSCISTVKNSDELVEFKARFVVKK